MMMEKSYTKLQVSNNVFKLVLPAGFMKALQSRIGREFCQGEPMEITLLDNQLGLMIRPMAREEIS